MPSAVVVGSGPNGLSAAIVLARAGLDVTVLEAQSEIGGGMRSAELTVPGLIHDVCSAAHPTGVASPFFESLNLEQHGLEWAWAPVEAAHPLDGGRAGVLHRDVEATAERLGVDGSAWRALFSPLADRIDDLIPELFGPVLHRPRHPRLLAGFGRDAIRSASGIARRWHGEEARALFAGLAAHTMRPLDQPLTGALGLVFAALGHSYGWPVAVGGSSSIASALESVLRSYGGRIETGHRVQELPDADVVMFDTSPDQVLDIVGDRLPGRVSRPLRRWQRGPGAFKVDFAVEGGVPWVNESARQAGTVHAGGPLEEVALAEAQVVAGRMPSKPFVLVCQQSLADPSRSVGDVHPVWAYAHVPYGYDGQVTEALTAQIERFAPGFRDRIMATSIRTPADLHADNANYLGGDVTGGANSARQTLFRPRIGPSPYSLAVPGLYLCSASTPPGGGVHGMAGYHAANAALRRL